MSDPEDDVLEKYNGMALACTAYQWLLAFPRNLESVRV